MTAYMETHFGLTPVTTTTQEERMTETPGVSRPSTSRTDRTLEEEDEHEE